MLLCFCFGFCSGLLFAVVLHGFGCVLTGAWLEFGWRFAGVRLVVGCVFGWGLPGFSWGLLWVLAGVLLWVGWGFAWVWLGVGWGFAGGWLGFGWVFVWVLLACGCVFGLGSVWGCLGIGCFCFVFRGPWPLVLGPLILGLGCLARGPWSFGPWSIGAWSLAYPFHWRHSVDAPEEGARTPRLWCSIFCFFVCCWGLAGVLLGFGWGLAGFWVWFCWGLVVFWLGAWLGFGWRFAGGWLVVGWGFG